MALGVDPAGNLYAADATNNLIRKITPLGEVSTFVGSGQVGYRNGAPFVAQFSGLSSLAFDKAGSLYVGEGFNNTCIRKVTPSGAVTTFAGAPFGSRPMLLSPDGADTVARFISVVALTFDLDDNLFASDIGSIGYYASSAIRKIVPDGYVRTIAGYASGITNQGQLLGNTPMPFRFLSLVTNRANNLVGVDYGNQLVYQITPTRDVSLLLTGKPLSNPRCLIYDKTDNLLIANGQQIVQVSQGGLVRILAGSDQAGFVNDSLRLARFRNISSLAVYNQNTLYIADQGCQCIRRARLIK